MQSIQSTVNNQSSEEKNKVNITLSCNSYCSYSNLVHLRINNKIKELTTCDIDVRTNGLWWDIKKEIKTPKQEKMLFRYNQIIIAI